MVKFSTDIDCCKRFMTNISIHSPLDINPMIGDDIVVCNQNGFVLRMKVVERCWEIHGKGLAPTLHCTLGRCSFWNKLPLTDFINMMKDRGFN